MFDTWHTYGVGINVSKIKTDADHIRTLIEKSTYVTDLFKNYLLNEYINANPDTTDSSKAEIKENLFNGASYEDFIEISDFIGLCGLASILNTVIFQDIGLSLTDCNDSNSDDQYLVLEPMYPWEYEALQPNIKPLIANTNELRKLFAKYVAILTHQSLEQLDWGNQEIEGWA